MTRIRFLVCSSDVTQVITVSNDEMLRKVQKHLYEGLKNANQTAERAREEPGMRPSTHFAFKEMEEAHKLLAAYMEDQGIAEGNQQ